MDSQSTAHIAPHVPMMSLSSVLRRIINYLIEGFTVSFCAFVLPQKKLNVHEVIMIGLTASATFAVLDIFSPMVGTSVRHGAGLGIGAGLVGFGGVPPIGLA